MDNTSKKKKPVYNFFEERNVTKEKTLCKNYNKNDQFGISVDDTNSITFVSEEGPVKVETHDVNILHYKIDDEDLLCISINDDNLGKCDKVEDLVRSSYSKAGFYSGDFEFDSQVEFIISGCHDKSNGHSNTKSDSMIDLKTNGNSILNNVDSNFGDHESRLKNIISNYATGPNISIIKKKRKKREYKCTIGDCKRSFLHIGTLKQHQLLHNENKFKCKYCGKVLSNFYRLKDHESTHFDEKGIMIYYRCLVPDCDEEFCSGELLRNHEVSHDLPSRPFICEICDKHFNKRRHYINHLLIHDTESSYNCLECGKCFVYEAALKHHKRSHLTAKKFTCNQCEAGFVKFGNFSRHMEIHESRRHYCKICKIFYNYSSTLTKHIIKEHPIARNKELELLNDGKRKKKKKNIITCVRKLYSHFKYKK